MPELEGNQLTPDQSTPGSLGSNGPESLGGGVSGEQVGNPTSQAPGLEGSEFPLSSNIPSPDRQEPGRSWKEKLGDWFKAKREKREVGESEVKKSRWEFLKNPPVIDGVKKLWENVTNKLPFPDREDVAKLINKVREKASNVKVLGQPLADFVIGAGFGAGARQLAKMGAAVAGGGGFGTSMFIGFFAGGTTAATREYLKIRREINKESPTEIKTFKDRIKRELRGLSWDQRKRLVLATTRGAVFGAIGGLAGGAIVDFIHDHLPVSGAEVVPSGGLPESGGNIETPFAASPEAPAPIELQEFPSEVPVETPMDVPPPEIIQLTSPAETINLAQGSNPWSSAERYLTDNLGRTPTTDEVREAVTRMIDDSQIPDATKLPPGFELKMGGVNDYLTHLLAEQPVIPAELGVLPDTILLPQGATPWGQVDNYLQAILERPPTDAETLRITQEVCRQSGIGVPSWGIPGAVDHRALPVGFKLLFNNSVKEMIGEIKIK